jgi:hypothetical protein
MRIGITIEDDTERVELVVEDRTIVSSSVNGNAVRVLWWVQLLRAAIENITRFEDERESDTTA